jgi:heat shock protein HtpX
MGRTWYEPDRRLTITMCVALLLVAVVDAAVATALALLFLPSLAALGVGAAVVAGQIVLAPRLALRSLGAKVVGPDDRPELHRRLIRLAQHLDVPVPRLAISPTDAPVAFAVGATERGAVICVSEGLLERLDPAEREAVLAHELAHIAHRDAMVMGAAASLLTVTGLMVRAAFWDGCIESGVWVVLGPATVLGIFLVRVVLIVPIAAAAVV